MEPISEHISWQEAVDSPTAARNNIDNTPSANIIVNMKLVAEKCFEPIRNYFGIPIRVDDFYRCPALNKLVGGVPNSDHQNGCAIDFSLDDRDKLLEILKWAETHLDYDQLINEYPDMQGRPKWIHISYRSATMNRHEFLTIK